MGRFLVKKIKAWMSSEQGGFFDGSMYDLGMVLFSLTALLLIAGLLYGAINSSTASMVHVFSNLF
ncbi:hypothetical protein [Sulfoacidibacillus ferrooxidans]|uniref:Uncharacterized protein n=1 Tax=Sulfoacidibacillus ferrooxidans TaxID=2005001 RepID=A0A9X1VC05_9BACL|nr:hypothetical protein [Sulfoacidibacillus ferrooxidans]MCI0184980.1 hypothetical protein [Sulfoacidibacillus ferrooxidans]